MAQLLVPTSDQSVGSWTNAPLWSKTNVDDNTDAISEAVGNNADTSNADLKLASGLTPQAGTQTLRVRWHHDQAGRSLQATCELYEGDPAAGGSLIATLQSATDVGTTEVEDTTTVTGISDYSNLYVRLRGRGTGGGPGRSLHVDLVELSIPDAGAVPKEGTGSASTAVSTSAAGKKTGKGTGTSSSAVTTSGQGEKTGKGTGVSSLVLSVSGTGTVVGAAKEGSGLASLALSGSGQAKKIGKATATSSLTVTVTGTGAHAEQASAALVVSVTGTAKKVAKGTGMVSMAVSTSATGSNPAGGGDPFQTLRVAQVNMVGTW